MQDISSNDSTYKIPIHISQNVQIESSDNLLVVGAPKQESAEKILIPNLLSGTSSYLVIDPDGIICSELPATDFCEQKSMGASGRPLSCTAGRYCRNKTDPGCGITQGVTCGFAVHLAFTWVCRQNPKLSSKQRPEPVPIGR